MKNLQSLATNIAVRETFRLSFETLIYILLLNIKQCGKHKEMQCYDFCALTEVINLGFMRSFSHQAQVIFYQNTLV